MTVLPATPRAVRFAAELIRQGRIVAYPTETAYGLACDPRQRDAVTRLFRIKGRERKPVALLAADFRQAKQACTFTALEEALARRFWPGPLTLIVQPRVRFPRQLLAGRKRVGIRVSASRIARQLARAVGFPVTATSANRSQQPECYSATRVIRAFRGRRWQPDCVLAAGSLSKRKPSTVLEVLRGRLVVHRQGSVRVPTERIFQGKGR